VGVVIIGTVSIGAVFIVLFFGVAVVMLLALCADKAGGGNWPFQLQEAVRAWFGGRGLQLKRGTYTGG
jgi:hypothetical protein